MRPTGAARPISRPACDDDRTHTHAHLEVRFQLLVDVAFSTDPSLVGFRPLGSSNSRNSLRVSRCYCRVLGRAATNSRRGPPERDVILMLPVPQIDGGLVVAIVGILNGAINGIAPLVLPLLRGLGLPV